MTRLYEDWIRPAMFRLDAETAHEVGINALRFGLGPKFAQQKASERYAAGPLCAVERFGLKFPSLVGVAAGFDKNGVVVDQLAALGFGFVEVGTVTHRPQAGNEKPRLFRLPNDQALINRLGFNNDGAAVVADRLRKIQRRCIVGVNIGKNKDVPNEEAIENYLASFDLVHDVADYIAVNVSSPNTPNLRELQTGASLEELIGALAERNRALSLDLGKPPNGGIQNAGGTQNQRSIQRLKPLLVKIAPDLSEPEIETIVDVCLRLEVDGIIATNTTVLRDGLRTPNVADFGAGGLSGRPLAARSTEVIRKLYRYSKGKMPVVGVGGVFDENDAFEKLAAGACLLQAYTGFVYVGPSYARDINLRLPRLIKKRGFSSIDEVVGSEA
ncbi:MAG TPA: quinone-dependent dihydroorotate dehydrogenase [Pyrinomonadaceae bacterium]